MKQILFSAVLLFIGISLSAQSIIHAEYDTPGAIIRERHKPSTHVEDGVIKIDFIGIDFLGFPSKTVFDESSTTIKDSAQRHNALNMASITLFEQFSGTMESFRGSVKYTYHTLSAEERDSLNVVKINAIEKNSRKPYYKLYPTDNIWNFIELDTVTGKLWQVQYSVDKDSEKHRFKTFLDLRDKREMTDSPDLFLPGRFELYKTQNMYNFLLLDTLEGHVWQVQWSIDPGLRGAVLIDLGL